MIADFFLIHKILIFLINIISVCLFCTIYFSNSKSNISRIFILMIVSMLLWVDFAFWARLISEQSSLAMFFLKIAWLVTPIFFLSLYFFTIYLIKENYRYRFLSVVVFLVGIIISILTGSTNLILSDVKSVGNGLEIIYGQGMFPFLIIISFIIFSTLYPLIRKYLKISTKEKTRIEYFLIGICIFYLANIIFNIILPLFFGVFHLYYFGDYSIIILLIFTTYAITKHELLGIKTLVTQILITIISIILLVDIVYLSNDIMMQLLKIGVLVTFLYFSHGMVNSVKKEKGARKKLEDSHKKIDQNVKDLRDINIKLKERNEDLGVLLNVSDITTETLDPRKIAQDIVDSVPKNLSYLKYVASFMVLYDPKTKHTYAYFITESIITKKIRSLVGKTLGKRSGEISVCLSSDNLIARTIEKKKIQISNKLEDFIAPSVDVNVCRIIQKLAKAKSYVSTPLFSGGRVVGAIIFVSTKPKKEIIQRDRRILSGFSSHIGSAIENAKLYKKTNMQMKELGMLNTSLKSMNQNLEELLEMKNEFLHITSHQLRTPLTAIRGMLSMWYEGDFKNLPEKDKKRMLKRILVSADRLNNITNDMLDTMELEGGSLKFKFRSVSIVKIIKETIDTLKPNFDKKNIYIRLKVSSEVSNVEVEPNYIRQVFMNIIDNACKYTKEGGVSINVEKDDKYIKVTIKDTGVGIGKIDQRKIFDKFTRGRNAVSVNASGSGLGLFIAKKIIKEHKGKIKIESKGVGKGSTVKIHLRINNN